MASSSNGKPRATSSSFHSSSFNYQAFRPLFDDSDDEDDDNQEEQSSLQLQPPPAPSCLKKNVVGTLSAPTSSSYLSPSLSTPVPNQTTPRFHDASFNYQSFRPLFDDWNGEEENVGRVDVARGVDGVANNRGRSRKASVDDQEEFEAVTPDLLPQQVSKEVEEGLKLDVTEVGKEKGGADGLEEVLKVVGGEAGGRGALVA